MDVSAAESNKPPTAFLFSGIVFVGVGILMFFVWPVIQSGIYALGDLVLKSGYAGTWVWVVIIGVIYFIVYYFLCHITLPLHIHLLQTADLRLLPHPLPAV